MEHKQWWPETLRNEVRTLEPFPRRMVLAGLLPGAIGLVAVGIALLLLMLPKRQQILYWSDTALQQTTAGDNLTSSLAAGSTLERPASRLLTDQLTVVGAPVWRPTGQDWVTTVWDEDQTKVALYRRGAEQPTLISSSVGGGIAVGADSWSPSGSHLALIERDPTQLLITLLNMETNSATPFDIPLNTHAGISWEPTRSALLVTTGATFDVTPTLKLLSPSGNVGNYEPDDGMRMRADGVFSPNGERVAYIASENYSVAQQILLHGQLWIADADGSNPQALVTAGMNFAPQWSADGTTVYFTRQSAGQYELRRIAIGDDQNERVGSSTLLMQSHPFDRHLWFAFAPNEAYLAHVGQDNGQLNVSVVPMDADEEISFPQRNCNTNQIVTLSWASTSRGVLINCANGNTRLVWVNDSLPAVRFPTGLYPVWQP